MSDNYSNDSTCIACGTANQHRAKFCANCGATLANQQSPYQSPSSQYEPPMVANFMYAGFWKRFIAYFIDGIIFNIIFVAFIVFGVGVNFQNSASFMQMGETVALLQLGYYLAWWMYYALQESSGAQATLGKRLLGIKVTDMQGNQLSFAHAAGRQLAGAVNAFTLMIGYLMAAFTGRKQALHDMIASAVVVNKNFGPQQIGTVNQSPPAGMSIGAIIGVIFLVLIIPVGGIIAAIALPAYQDYTIRSKVHSGMVHAESAKSQIINYAVEEGFWPGNFERIQISSKDMRTSDYYIQLKTNGVLAITFERPQQISGASLLLIPDMAADGSYQWECDGSEFKSTYLPAECR